MAKVRAGSAAGALLGALLLLIAEFSPLFHVQAAGLSGSIKSVTTGSHHTYALVPIGLLAATFALAVWRSASRPSLLAFGLLGVLTLLIAVLGDLPDATASGLVFRGGRYVSASSTPGLGLYLETLGGVVLLITCVWTFLLLGPPNPKRQGPIHRSVDTGTSAS